VLIKVTVCGTSPEVTQDINSLRTKIMELEEKIALKEQAPLQSGYQENGVFKS
jgi:hypothetical protein